MDSREYRKKYYEANKEKLKAYQKWYYRKNKNKINITDEEESEIVIKEPIIDDNKGLLVRYYGTFILTFD